VEAGANGQANLDDTSHYGNLFQRSFRDSGAILVGAGASGYRSPECFTDYGSRFDVQGWGDGVMTLGYGADDRNIPGISVNGSDTSQWYATGFNGTSSAAAMVAGAAADMQSYRKSQSLAVYTPAQLRSQMVATGTPQPTPVTQNIGPLPNLRGA